MDDLVLSSGEVDHIAVDSQFGLFSEDEEWRLCPLSDKYIVSNYGRVIRLSYISHYTYKGSITKVLRPARLLSPSGKSGYKEVLMYIDGNKKNL